MSGVRIAEKAALTIHGHGWPLRPPPLAYLATPYTRYPHGHVAAFREACRIAGILIHAGVCAYSPIAHSHPIAEYSDIDPLDGEFWFAVNKTMLTRSDVLIVAKMQGWQDSEGVRREIAFFETHKRAIYMLDPDSMSMRRQTDFD